MCDILSETLKKTFSAVLVGALILSAVGSLAEEAGKTLRDPTRPLNYNSPAEKQETLALQAIFTGKGRKEAIINGQVVTEGEIIGDARIVHIGDKQVRYVRDGQSHVLRLRQSITTPASSG